MRRKHEEDMTKRLRNLDRVDEWRDKEKLQNVTHLPRPSSPAALRSSPCTSRGASAQTA